MRNLLKTDVDELTYHSSLKLQVLVIASDAHMSSSSAATQCARAAVGMFRKLWSQRNPQVRGWQEDGSPISTLSCCDQQRLMQLQSAARAAGLKTHTVCDASRGEKSRCRLVMAIGPGPEAELDALTSGLSID